MDHLQTRKTQSFLKCFGEYGYEGRDVPIFIYVYGRRYLLLTKGQFADKAEFDGMAGMAGMAGMTGWRKWRGMNR